MAEVIGQLVGSVSFTEQEIAAFPRAPQWLLGHGPPSDANGANGDYYLNVETGDIYQKEAETWA